LKSENALRRFALGFEQAGANLLSMIETREDMNPNPKEKLK